MMERSIRRTATAADHALSIHNPLCDTSPRSNVHVCFPLGSGFPGTSSKSTKLVHGGVRYLQKAVFELDYEQYKMVREALHERKTFLHIAPYLSDHLPIMLPVYR